MQKFKSFFSKSKSKSNIKSPNEFIIDHNRNNQSSDRLIDISSFDTRRVVFVSLLGLHRTWEQCPSVILYHSIFLLPVKRHWISHHHQYSNQNSSNINLTIFLKLAKDEGFINLLRWKHSQGLLFCALDDYDDHEGGDMAQDVLVHPFWSFLSKQLCNLYDERRNKYNPLKLSGDWWTNTELWSSKYGVNTADILSELYFVTLKFKTMQEILYQANPDTLLVVTCYQQDMYRSPVIFYDDEDEEQEQNWTFTENYNPYDHDHDDME